MFDEVLQGKPPEVLVVRTHETIAALLQSVEGQRVAKGSDNSYEASEKFIKQIIEAVSPIIPITVRNKSLDSDYFRAALQLLGAAELLFTQYESDVRVQANPAGVVGMCTALHESIERGALFNEELSSLKKSMSDMKAQYQTSLGLGSPFRKDSISRAKRQAKRSRRRSYSRMQSYDTQELARAQLPYPNFGSQAFASGGLQNSRGTGRGRTSTAPSRGRGPCYAFQAGECNRGRACRFSHLGG